jgi:hypothetical protein
MYFMEIFKATMVALVTLSAATSAIASPNLNSFFSHLQFDLPPLLKDLKFGINDSEIQRIIPTFKQYYFKVNGNEDIKVHKIMSGRSLYSIDIDLATDFTKTASFLQQKWGKAIIRKNVLDEREYHWLSAEKGIRAELRNQSNQSNQAELRYYRYIPIQTLFPKNVPSLPQPIKDIKIGSPIEDIKKLIPDFRDKDLPNRNWTDLEGYFDVRIWYFSGKESRIDFLSLSFSSIENVHSILVKKWGNPKKDLAGREYWKNDNLEYIDVKGNTQKGLFIIYNPEKYAHHSLDFKSNL